MGMRKKENGYMTVEASLVMSVVLMVYLFIIRYSLWCYDRAMLEQDIGVMLLRTAGAKEMEMTWQQEKRNLRQKQYLWIGDKEASLEKGLFTLTITGKAKGGNMDSIGIRYEMVALKPQQWLRGKEKVVEKKEEGDKLE